VGVEYRHYLIPRPNFFRPDVGQLCSFLQELIAHKWISPLASAQVRRMLTERPGMTYHELAARTGAFAKTARGFSTVPGSWSLKWEKYLNKDTLLSWPVTDLSMLDLRYPFEHLNSVRDEVYYDLEIHLSCDYVYRCSECIDPFDDTNCRCGQSLEYANDDRVFYASRIRYQCPDCGREFDVSQKPAVLKNGLTGEKSTVPGGATYRFALAVDCGKWLPSRSAVINLHPDLVDLCQSALQHPFYEVGDYY
jgi:DNA-directed RNA polymerase subunit RPC12/RpoP